MTDMSGGPDARFDSQPEPVYEWPILTPGTVRDFAFRLRNEAAYLRALGAPAFCAPWHTDPRALCSLGVPVPVVRGASVKVVAPPLFCVEASVAQTSLSPWNTDSERRAPRERGTLQSPILYEDDAELRARKGDVTGGDHGDGALWFSSDPAIFTAGVAFAYALFGGEILSTADGFTRIRVTLTPPAVVFVISAGVEWTFAPTTPRPDFSTVLRFVQRDAPLTPAGLSPAGEGGSVGAAVRHRMFTGASVAAFQASLVDPGCPCLLPSPLPGGIGLFSFGASTPAADATRVMVACTCPASRTAWRNVFEARAFALLGKGSRVRAPCAVGGIDPPTKRDRARKGWRAETWRPMPPLLTCSCRGAPFRVEEKKWTPTYDALQGKRTRDAYDRVFASREAYRAELQRAHTLAWAFDDGRRAVMYVVEPWLNSAVQHAGGAWPREEDEFAQTTDTGAGLAPAQRYTHSERVRCETLANIADELMAGRTLTSTLYVAAADFNRAYRELRAAAGYATHMDFRAAAEGPVTYTAPLVGGLRLAREAFVPSRFASLREVERPRSVAEIARAKESRRAIKAERRVQRAERDASSLARRSKPRAEEEGDEDELGEDADDVTDEEGL